MKVQNLPVVDSPATEPLEAIINTYFQIKGYFTSSNKWFWVFDENKKQRGYQDIDVLAFSETETLIVSVSANLDDKIRFDKNKLIKNEMLTNLRNYFNRSILFLKSVPEYSWLVKKDRTIKCILAYGSGKKLHQKISPYLEKENIDLLSVTDSIEYIKETVKKQTDHGLKTNNQIIKLVQYQLLNTFSQNTSFRLVNQVTNP